jgi:serine phosphatase RsbU (regulator of sigma subunit)
MIRAYAVDDPDPVSVLTRVDRYLQVIESAQLITALYLLIDAGSGEVKIATAGHLPPLIVGAGGGVLAPTLVGTPLGIAAGPRKSTVLTLERNRGIIAFTDGLVERRGEDIEVGIDEIVASTRASTDLDDAWKLLYQVVGAAPHGGQDDDVTVLALYRH